MKISTPFILRNCVKNQYPIKRVIESIYGLCDCIVISVDPLSEDATLEYVIDLKEYFILKRNFYGIKIVYNQWNLENNLNGSEFAIQTNKAIEECLDGWILLLQADEAIRESDHSKIRRAISSAAITGIDAYSMTRLYFYGKLSCIRSDWTCDIIRLFRKGYMMSCGDAMNTEMVKPGVIVSKLEDVPIFHYSRIGDPLTISKRILSLDKMFHLEEKLVSEKDLKPYDFKTRKFDCMSKKNVDVGNKEVEESFLDYLDSHPKAFEGYDGKMD